MMSVKALSYEELMERLRAEYERMIDRWETGGLFWHFKVYLKKFSKKHWVRHASTHYKKPVCAILALSRLGLPITSTAIQDITEMDPYDAYARLLYLSSYGILEPTKPTRFHGAKSLRAYKINPGFLTYVYRALKDLEDSG